MTERSAKKGAEGIPGEQEEGEEGQRTEGRGRGRGRGRRLGQRTAVPRASAEGVQFICRRKIQGRY